MPKAVNFVYMLSAFSADETVPSPTDSPSGWLCGMQHVEIPIMAASTNGNSIMSSDLLDASAPCATKPTAKPSVRC